MFVPFAFLWALGRISSKWFSSCYMLDQKEIFIFHLLVVLLSKVDKEEKLKCVFLLISSWKRCTRHKHRYILWVMKLPSFSGGNRNSVNPPCDIQSSNMLDHLLSFISEEIRKKQKRLCRLLSILINEPRLI
jgi:hypothetical protein